MLQGSEYKHISVLLRESMEALNIKPDGVYGHVGMTQELMQENAKITLSVPASMHHRPDWD